MNMRQVWVTFLAALCAVFIAMPKAQAAGRGIDRATGQALWDAAVNGKTTTIGTGAGAMKVIRPVTTTTGTPVSNGAGGARVVDVVATPVGSVNVPVSTTTTVTKDAILNGITGLATGGVLGAAIGAGATVLSSYLNTNGVRVNSSTGAVEVMKEVGGNYSCSYGGFTSTNSSARLCAQDVANKAGRKPPDYEVRNDSPTLAIGQWTIYLTGTTSSLGAVSFTGVIPGSPTWDSATSQDIKDALYKNNPPPPIIDDMSKYGNINWPGPSSISGPASVTGPKETSVTSSGGQTSTTVSQDSTPITYSGPSATAGNTTRTSTTTKSDGTSSTTTTTTEPGTEATAEPKEETESVDPPVDTALPAVPELYTRKYPDGMVGIWNTTKSQLAQSPLMQLKDQLMPSLPSSGSCPVFTVPADLAVWAPYGMLDVSPPCWVWDFGRLVVIISALLLARALIFGG